MAFRRYMIIFSRMAALFRVYYYNFWYVYVPSLFRHSPRDHVVISLESFLPLLVDSFRVFSAGH